LEVSEGRRVLGPRIESQDGLMKTRHGFEESLVEGHVQGGRTGSGVEQEPGVISGIHLNRAQD
jgi:hypothetical protein